MKIASLISLAALCFARPVAAATYTLDGNGAISVIHDLWIGEDLYDVCFDGSFPSQSVPTGDDALEAASSITGFLNAGGFVDGSFLRLASGPGSGGVFYIVVEVYPPVTPADLGTARAAGGMLAAGWVNFSDLGVPADFQNTMNFRMVPEPSVPLLAGFGLLSLLVRRRR